jgi:phosphoenolpyruvate carboxykinase (GTP)
MAMWPFCGYNMGDYFRHWITVGRTATRPPRVFRVNWFRTDANGKFMWPGFGENLRVLKWVLDRCDGTGKATETVIGAVPTLDAIDVDGLVSPDRLQTLLQVDPAEWVEAVAAQEDFFATFGSHVPQEMRDEQQRLARAVDTAIHTPEVAARSAAEH